MQTYSVPSGLTLMRRLPAQRDALPDDLSDQRPGYRATGRDCGLWAAIFCCGCIIIDFWQRNGPLLRLWS